MSDESKAEFPTPKEIAEQIVAVWNNNEEPDVKLIERVAAAIRADRERRMLLPEKVNSLDSRNIPTLFTKGFNECRERTREMNGLGVEK